MSRFVKMVALFFATGIPCAAAVPWGRPQTVSHGEEAIAPVPVPASPQPAMRASMEETFRRAIELSGSQRVEDVAEAARLLATVVNGPDARLARLASTRYGKAIAALLKMEPSRAADVALPAWQSAPTNQAFVDGLRTVYAELAKKGATTSVSVASSGMCGEIGKRLGGLMLISEKIGKVDDNVKWRTAYAEHLRGCDATPESLGEAYALYVELGDAEKAAATATARGDLLIERFKSGARAWQVIDFTQATEAYVKAGLQKDVIVRRVAELGKQAEHARKYEAAAQVYEYAGMAEDAEIARMLQEMQGM